MWKTYYTPATLDEVLGLLAQYGSDARLIAGGTDILIELDRKIRTPRALIDITRISELDRIRLESGTLHLGPLVTHNHVVGSELLVERAYPLARACWEVGAPQIRNRGTIAGNLITASPANDTITPLWALGASITLKSYRGERTLPFEQFFLGVRKTALAPDEMLTDISFPAMQPNERGVFVKLALRRTQAIAVVNTAILLGFEGDRIGKARITLGSVAPTIVRAPDAENFLEGKTLSDSAINAAGELATAAARPIDDVRGTAEYRSEMIRVTTIRALRMLRDGTERADWPVAPAMLWGTTDGHFPAGNPRSARASLPGAKHAEDGEQPIETRINGKPYTIRRASDKTLLRMLREDAGLIGTKEGCAEGECGACTAFLDGIAVMACMVAAPRAHGSEIVTIEGLARDGALHPIQQAFVAEDAVQCGYCTPGFVMAGAKLLEECPYPTRYQIEQSISGNLCRCTGYFNILNAIERAARHRTCFVNTPDGQ
ncbi:MAG TPA: FAD binding domain-containing protein [Anaerolineae bacterium]|nr:FAD binding domain-containing protein [Anaerolineae bacterium]